MRISRRFRELTYQVFLDSGLEKNQFAIEELETQIQYTYLGHDSHPYFLIDYTKEDRYYLFKIIYYDIIKGESITQKLTKWGKVPQHAFEQTVSKEISKRLKYWLNQVDEELSSPSSFEEYYNRNFREKNLRIYEITQDQVTSEESSAILIDNIEKIETIVNDQTDIILTGQEVLFEDLEDIKDLIKKGNSPIRLILNSTIGALISWGLNYAIPSRFVLNLGQMIIDGIRQALGT